MKKLKLNYFQIILLIIKFLFLLPSLLYVLCNKKLRNKVYDDLEAKYTGEKKVNLWHFLFMMSFEKSWRNLFYHRCRENGIGWILLRLILPPNKDTFIKPSCEIGNFARFVHAHCVHINCDSIGHHFVIYHCVTIGGINGKTPVIGNNVTVGCHSAILGGVTIGDNVNIGAGTIVTKDVPDNCTIVGNSAYIVKLNGDKVNIKL